MTSFPQLDPLIRAGQEAQARDALVGMGYLTSEAMEWIARRRMELRAETRQQGLLRVIGE